MPRRDAIYPATRVAAPVTAATRPVNGHGALPKGERIVMLAVAQRGPVTREQLTVLTGYKRSTRDAYLSRLRDRECLTDDGRLITATDAGVSALGGFEPLPSGADLRAHYLATLPEGEAKILGVLVEAYPETVDRDALSDGTGYKRSTRDAYLHRLAARRLVDSTRDGVRAHAELFA